MTDRITRIEALAKANALAIAKRIWRLSMAKLTQNVNHNSKDIDQALARPDVLYDFLLDKLELQ